VNALTGSAGQSIRLLMLGIAAVGIQALMFSPLLTDIAQGLETGAKEMGLASAAYGVGVAISALAAAPKLGVWPKRTAIRVAFALMAAGLGLCSVAWAWPLLAAGQLITGLASGVIIPATYAVAGDISPPDAGAGPGTDRLVGRHGGGCAAGGDTVGAGRLAWHLRGGGGSCSGHGRGVGAPAQDRGGGE
jgi:MFS family permease